jgi:hypothetical protein
MLESQNECLEKYYVGAGEKRSLGYVDELI